MGSLEIGDTLLVYALSHQFKEICFITKKIIFCTKRFLTKREKDSNAVKINIEILSTYNIF